MSVFIKPYWIKNVWSRVVPSSVRFAVTFRSRDLSEDDTVSYTDYSLSHVKRRTADVAEASESGAITDGYFSTSFLVWQSDLDTVSAPDPKVGDIIQLDSVNWQVQRVKRTLMDEVWDLGVQQTS